MIKDNTVYGKAITVPPQATNTTPWRGYVQQVLPPSSRFNMLASWEVTPEMVLPVGMESNKIFEAIKDDMIYLVGHGVVKVGNLKTKQWDELDIPTQIGPPAIACLFDDYKLFLCENSDSTTAKTSIVNLTDRTSVLGPTIQHNLLSDGISTVSGEKHYNVNIGALMPSVFVPETRCIYFVFIANGGRYGYQYDSESETCNPQWCLTSYVLYGVYNVDTNTITKALERSIPQSGQTSSETLSL